MKIVEYNGHRDVLVEFQDEHKARVHTAYGNFIRHSVRNPYDKTVYDVGYLGEGKYKVYIDQDHLEPVYNVWRTLLHGRPPAAVGGRSPKSEIRIVGA